MGRLVRGLIVGSLIGLAGCASTQIQRAHQLGALGKAYADAVTVAGDEALASSVAFSLPEIRKERQGFACAPPKARADVLQDQIDRLQKRQALVLQSNEQVALLGEYFSDLGRFAKEDVAGPVEASMG